MLDHIPGVPGTDDAPGDKIPSNGGSTLDVNVRRVPPGVNCCVGDALVGLASFLSICFSFGTGPDPAESVGPANDCSNGFGSRSSVFLADPDPLEVGDPTTELLTSVWSDVIMT
ncbi:hypothetical protein OGAPHI_001727 [Ogataea philodendri]|uniref:Uncharacterized protein n=1 Tax=Ogataea philodendri TaxID=1378263 RepID=A0A9P8P916_9ASCO|nr:uncharacterized protein OGAPHI_001727 [Ogataea philodendri]KAH3667973.1 hypothetical protein OGAPHI_001727 [Ogataea philodendri]